MAEPTEPPLRIGYRESDHRHDWVAVLTRMIGGAFSPARWVPIAALIEMNPQGRSGTRVLVRLADNLGVTFRKGAWTKLVRRRFDQVYDGLDALWKV